MESCLQDAGLGSSRQVDGTANHFDASLPAAADWRDRDTARWMRG